MKKLYMKKLGLLVLLMVGLGFSQVKALTTYPSYSEGNDKDNIDKDAVISGSLTIDNNRALTVEGDLTVGGGFWLELRGFGRPGKLNGLLLDLLKLRKN